MYLQRIVRVNSLLNNRSGYSAKEVVSYSSGNVRGLHRYSFRLYTASSNLSRRWHRDHKTINLRDISLSAQHDYDSVDLIGLSRTLEAFLRNVNMPRKLLANNQCHVRRYVVSSTIQSQHHANLLTNHLLSNIAKQYKLCTCYSISTNYTEFVSMNEAQNTR